LRALGIDVQVRIERLFELDEQDRIQGSRLGADDVVDDGDLDGELELRDAVLDALDALLELARGEAGQVALAARRREEEELVLEHTRDDVVEQELLALDASPPRILREEVQRHGAPRAEGDAEPLLHRSPPARAL